MKTLDEVIKMAESCFEYPDCTGCVYVGIHELCGLDWATDALHHLKEYKRVQGRIEKIAIGNIEDTLAKLDNPPLTWDELKKMEGKPVWVEEDYGYKHWEIIDGVHEEDASFEAEYSFSKDTYGTEWQAYRKERE